jgi:hypothetical protein
MFKKNSVRIFIEKIYKMGCLGGSGLPVLYTGRTVKPVNEQRNILHEMRKRKANWISHALRRSCLIKQVIEGKIKGEMEVTKRRGR